MITHVMVYVYLFGVRILLYLQYVNWWLEVDCGVDEPNSFDDDPQDTFDQATGFSLCISICTEIMHTIMFTFGYISHNLMGFG